MDLAVNESMKGDEADPAIMSTLIHLGFAWEHEKFSNGSVFSFTKALTKMFELTDVEDIPLTELHLPFRTVFLHFQRDREIKASFGSGEGQERIFNGLYLCKTPEFFGVSLVWGNGTYNAGGTHDQNMLLDLADGVRPDDTIKKAFNGLIDYRKNPQRQNLEDKNPVFCGGLEHGIYANAFFKNAPHFQQSVVEALELIAHITVNAVFYLSNYGSEIEYTYPEHLEPLEKKMNAHPKDSKQYNKIRAHLNPNNRINLCGRKQQRERDKASLEEYELCSHWRRGHWRRQAIGVNWSDHRLIWIHPAIIRRDKGDPHGHTYITQPKGETK